MTAEILTHPVPLQRDAEGVWRVAGSRLYLDLLVAEYWQGWTPEQIVDAHPSLDVAQVYAIVAWYLANRTEVDRYLDGRREQAAALKESIERDSGRAPVVERLSTLALERRSKA